MLDFRTPLLNVAGALGFFPRSRGTIPINALGAFITNPISAQARKSANAAQQIDFPGGVLLHSGHPNPGISACIKQYGEKWSRAPLPIIVHLLADDASKINVDTRRLEEIDNIMAIELGLHPQADVALVRQLCTAALGELPLIAHLPFDRAQELAPVVIEAGISAISLAAPRGRLPDEQQELVAGRLYGPSIFPQALQLVEIFSSYEIPLIGSGGIYQKEQAVTMLEAGATAVQLDTVLWKTDMQLKEWLHI
jgi:dihydroorotate dehydrogenase (NAD+) catalytic subunit